MRIEAKDWVLEAESKLWGVTRKALENRVAKLKKTKTPLTLVPLFSGTNTTWAFNNALEKGSGARVRLAVSDTNQREYIATIKRPHPHDSPGQITKNKLELNENVRSVQEGYDWITEVTRSLGMLSPLFELKNDLIVQKARHSYILRRPDKLPVRTDVDKLSGYTFEPSRKDFEKIDLHAIKPKLKWAEFEENSVRAALDKEKDFISLAKLLGFSFQSGFATLSTRAILDTLHHNGTFDPSMIPRSK